MSKIKKNIIYTFVPNMNHMDTKFSGTETPISIPGTKILEAMQFCERERLDIVYLTREKGNWTNRASASEKFFYIEMTSKGFTKATHDMYIIHQASPSL